MKKHSTDEQKPNPRSSSTNPRRAQSRGARKIRVQTNPPARTNKPAANGAEAVTIGVDLGDKNSRYCALDRSGQVLIESSVATTEKAVARLFAAIPPSRVAIEVGTHSPWVSRLLARLGHEVIVANPRQLKLITQSSRKDDRVDARTLARLARVDPELLHPIRHRSEQAQLDLMFIRARAGLVKARTQLINEVRGLAKSAGERLPSCDADQMVPDKLAALPEALRSVLMRIVKHVAELTQGIHEYDEQIRSIARERYAEETARLRQVDGVGEVISLTFVLTLGDEHRFERSRDVGCYLGMRPRRSDSGESHPELHISKEGDPYLRSLLVEGAQHILSRRGRDSDLRRWGLKLASRGGRNAKKRAVVAVARKLAVLLHRLWRSGEVYDPLRNSRAAEAALERRKGKVRCAAGRHRKQARVR